ncbi:transcriptional activator Trip230 protein [Chlamydia pneumoniae TW-183]|uniref:Uncharacterized protein n=2 Tax=Chlamydia pneumoniae TaxID=83558 RepID=Q9Z7E1_CHLPN|nr:hypothetical protein [Chlamydia pneumoniae]AAD18903.1 CT647 hypothetical protein [Chlamydia pneumoniae CWL029]AAF38875.1 conserved hypothetical protein [Chlamydia pneumoniae AR39]AAP98722.1 transcriptional activator Trip230 protein [Chlamydia pneumoniae TW-183]ACZ32654.1 conserved hypothetical protein [Chlamydia pneumoniae LPCoLN]ETR79512.1 transcriptional activator protein [Chlamydia pneumoniae B21]
MKKWISILILSFLSLLSILPVLAITINHVKISQRWSDLNSQILTLKVIRDHEDQVIKHNARISKDRNNLSIESLNASCKQLRPLSKERERLNKLNSNSLLAQSKEVWERKRALEKSNHQLVWNCEQMHNDFAFVRLEQATEMDNEDIESLFSLFNPENPVAPLVFFTCWKMTKQTTPLGNEVWLTHAEAISRWI